MKRFMLFKWNQYYPDGGMKDFHGSFNTRAEAIKAANVWLGSSLCDSAHVYDLKKEEITAYTDYDKNWVKN